MKFPMPAELTIDQLAQGAKLPVSTVRMYQQRRILAPPEKRGRVGYYGAEHQERLKLIAELQNRGFSLAAIKETLDSWEDGRPLSHLIGIADVAPRLQESPQRLSVADLITQFEGQSVSQADMVRAAELGLIAIDGAEVVVDTPAFLELGPAVAQLDIPVSRILDEYEALGGDVAAIVARFVQVFEDHVLVNGTPPADIADRVDRLTELASAVVVAELESKLRRTVADYLDRH